MARKRWTVDRATVCVAIGEMGPLPKKDRETVEDAKRFLIKHHEAQAALLQRKETKREAEKGGGR